MWIKICANTNLEDTQLALDLGADAVGFVFAPSARRVSPAQVAAINAALRPGPQERIGVFQTTSFQEIRTTVTIAHLTGIQLHHQPDPTLLAALRSEFGPTLTLIQTLHWPTDVPAETTAQTLARQYHRLAETGIVDRILVDAKVGQALGGTGQTFAWQHARALFQGAGSIDMIVAGGLNPENVREAIERLNPWGVDVASGVEEVPGRKGPEQLERFIQNARAQATL